MERINGEQSTVSASRNSPSGGETPKTSGICSSNGRYVPGIVGALFAGAKGATFELTLILRRFPGERERHIFQL